MNRNNVQNVHILLIAVRNNIHLLIYLSNILELHFLYIDRNLCSKSRPWIHISSHAYKVAETFLQMKVAQSWWKQTIPSKIFGKECRNIGTSNGISMGPCVVLLTKLIYPLISPFDTSGTAEWLNIEVSNWSITSKIRCPKTFIDLLIGLI